MHKIWLDELRLCFSFDYVFRLCIKPLSVDNKNILLCFTIAKWILFCSTYTLLFFLLHTNTDNKIYVCIEYFSDCTFFSFSNWRESFSSDINWYNWTQFLFSTTQGLRLSNGRCFRPTWTIKREISMDEEQIRRLESILVRDECEPT